MKPKITYHSNGQIESEKWMNEAGRFHRLDGPAFRTWYRNGQLGIELWCVHGNRHRLDGPAYRDWDSSGSSPHEWWYINGVEYKTEAEFLVAVDLYKANEIAELF